MSAEALIQLSSLSTFPIPVDDISSACKAEEIVFNGVRHTTISGTKYPLETVLLSSNKSFIESDR